MWICSEGSWLRLVGVSCLYVYGWGWQPTYGSMLCTDTGRTCLSGMGSYFPLDWITTSHKGRCLCFCSQDTTSLHTTQWCNLTTCLEGSQPAADWAMAEPCTASPMQQSGALRICRCVQLYNQCKAAQQCCTSLVTNAMA